MKRMKRLLSWLLAAALLGGLLPVSAAAALPCPLLPVSPAAEPAAEAATGSISATVRIDYAQNKAALAARNVRAELRQGDSTLLAVPLSRASSETQNGCAVTVGLRDADGGDLGAGDWPAYLDLTVDGLAKGDYQLCLVGTGYRTFTQDLTIGDASQHVTLGTGDGTFTLGDCNDDGTVDQADRDALSAALGATDRTNMGKFDLNGDGKIDIIDLAYVTRNASGLRRDTLGKAEVRSTALLAPLAAGADAALSGVTLTRNVGGSEEAATLAQLLAAGTDVRVTPKESTDRIELPIPLNNVDVREVRITSPDIESGELKVVYSDDVTEDLPFGQALPEGVRAVGRAGDGYVRTVELGRRVAVKKVTISVEKTAAGYVTVSSVQFLRDIVPENPVAANHMVRNLQATPGSGKVDLRWDALPNVTGYTVSYAPTDRPESRREVRTDKTTASVSGLEDLQEYTFTVTPTAAGWAGKGASVTATPVPTRAPDAPDMITVTAQDGALRVGWKAAKGATYYQVYCGESAQSAQPAGGHVAGTAATVGGLTNGKTYSVYVRAGNAKGLGAPSRVHTGTPIILHYDRPAGIPAQGVLDHTAIESMSLKAGYNVSPSSYSAAKPFRTDFMYDGDYATHWTSHSYGDGNWWNDKTVYCNFKSPQTIGSVIWVPRLDGGYASNLRLYTVTVWKQGESLSGPGHLVAGGSASDAKTWLPVRGNPASTHFAVLPIEPTEDVVRVAITIEQVGYSAVSLSELLFLQYDENHRLPEDIDALFADALHTQLKPGVDQARLDALRARLESSERNYYLDLKTMTDELALAEELLSGGTAGVVLRGIAARSGKADSQKYGQGGSDLQPLGAAARAGDEITVYAQGIPAGAEVQVVATQYNAEASAWQKPVGTLHNGRNILTIPQIGSQNTPRGGSLYLTYAGADPAGIQLHVRRATAIPTLELSGWYTMSEAARREAIGAYLDALQAYPAKAGVTAANAQTNCLNVTEISLPGVLLSLPAQAVLNGAAYAPGQNSRAAAVTTLYDSVLAWEDVMHICKTTQGIDKTYAQSDMTSRQNIRCMQMFSGAFMYAAGSHIGIGYGSCAGMVRGKPVSALASGAAANSLYGWGIAHEIGHNMDKLGKAEITNNLYSLMVQTYDGKANTLPSRLESSGKYEAVFEKVARGYPGASNDVFVQLALYWQLHLAYDDAAHPMDFYNRFFKAWKAGTYFESGASYDDKVALTAAGVAQKDLTEFFTRWGMTLSQSTKDKLASYGKETRALWYLTDQSRRARLTGAATATGTVSARAKKTANREVTVTIDRSGVTGKLQGFEILRDGVSVGFTTGETFKDTIGSANHHAYTYQVRAYDILGNPVGQAVEAGQVRIAYDATVDPGAYTVTRSGDTVTFALRQETAVSGILLTGASRPTEGSYTVRVNDKTARTGTFADNQAVDDKASFLAYLQKPGAAADDTRIWTYDATTVTISGIPEAMALSDVKLLSYAGDDVALLEGGFAGTLKTDYVYGTGSDERIAAGTLVVVGTYRGDPVYNGVRLRGRFTVTALDDQGEPVTRVEERDLDGYALLFAEIPADGKVSDISDGIFVFVPNVQKEAALQGVSQCQGVNLLPSQLRAELFRTDRPGDTASSRTTAQTLWVSAPGGDTLPEIELKGAGVN